MRPLLVPAVILAVCVAALAHARNGNFAVSVQVVDHRAAPAVLDAIPMPPQARPFATGNDGRSYAWPGSLDAAAVFFDSEMPRRGYRALSRSGDGEAMQQTWENDRGRVLLRLQRVLGTTPGTRIRVSAAAVYRRPDSPQPTHAGAP